MLVRSPTLTNSESSSIVSGSRPDSRMRRFDDGRHARGAAPRRPRRSRDVVRRRAAAAAQDVDQAAPRRTRRSPRPSGPGSRRTRRTRWAGRRSGSRRRSSRRSGTARRRTGASRRAERAVEPDRERPGVPDGVPERLGHLAGERAAGGVGDGAGDDHRPAAVALLEERLDGEDRGLGVERVEDGLDQQQVGAAVDQAAGLLVVRRRPARRRSRCARRGR